MPLTFLAQNPPAPDPRPAPFTARERAIQAYYSNPKHGDNPPGGLSDNRMYLPANEPDISYQGMSVSPEEYNKAYMDVETQRVMNNLKPDLSTQYAKEVKENLPPPPKQKGLKKLAQPASPTGNQ